MEEIKKYLKLVNIFVSLFGTQIGTFNLFHLLTFGFGDQGQIRCNHGKVQIRAFQKKFKMFLQPTGASYQQFLWAKWVDEIFFDQIQSFKRIHQTCLACPFSIQK